jgi:hypothetical protein
MVSIRQLEHEGIVSVMPVGQIDWHSIRSSLEYRLRSRGLSDDESEELADDAVVAAYAKNRGMTSQKRCAADARSCLAMIREESRQNVSPELSDDYLENMVDDRRKSMLTPDRPETTAARDELANIRETRILFAWFTRRYFTPCWYEV